MRTMIKAVHMDETGKVLAYDCSGKQGAPASKVRPLKSAPKAAPAGAAPAQVEGPPAQAAAAPGAAVPKSDAAKAAKGPKATKAPSRIFQVGERVRYWSSGPRKWFDTSIQAINLGPKGEVESYDLPGKPKAVPYKIRAAKDAKDAKDAKASVASAARPVQPARAAKSTGLVFGVAKQTETKVAEEADGKQMQTPPAKFKVGQNVLYFSEQLQKHLPTKVIRSIHSRSGKRYYDLSIKKFVLEARIRPGKETSSQDSQVKQSTFGAGTKVQQAQLPAEKRRNLRRVPPPPADEQVAEGENPPGPPTP